MRTASLAAIGLIATALAGCSKAPDGDGVGPQLGNATSSTLAFTYAYRLTLPARSIDRVQEAHAAACEALGPPRCRITGMRYSVDASGGVSAELTARVAAPLARRFGREAIAVAEREGASLTGADIGGSETSPDDAAAGSIAGDAQADLARIDRELARSDLPAAERATLQAQRAERLADQRGATRVAAGTRASIATAPVSFSYTTGHGAGFLNQLREAGDTALASATVTLGALLWLLAVLGPPAVAVLALVLLWRAFGRRWWTRLARAAERGHEPA